MLLEKDALGTTMVLTSIQSSELSVKVTKFLQSVHVLPHQDGCFKLLPFFLKPPTCSTFLFSLDDVTLWSTEWAPKDVHIFIPGTCGYVTLLKDFADVMNTMELNIERVAWIIQAGPI